MFNIIYIKEYFLVILIYSLYDNISVKKFYLTLYIELKFYIQIYYFFIDKLYIQVLYYYKVNIENI